MSYVSTFVAFCLVLIASALSANPRTALAQGYGLIEGRVTLIGQAPEPKQVQVTVDEATCGRSVKDETLIVGPQGGVANAIVDIPQIQTNVPLKPAAGLKLNQRGCLYHPHVMAFPVGSTLEIINSDGILHSFHTYSKLNPPMDLAQPGFKKVLRVTFTKPELIQVSCDQHNWMTAWLFVAANPFYAVTDASGRFRIEQVPPGSYQVRVWHERLGEQTKPVVVQEGRVTKVDFAMTLPHHE